MPIVLSPETSSSAVPCCGDRNLSSCANLKNCGSLCSPTLGAPALFLPLTSSSTCSHCWCCAVHPTLVSAPLSVFHHFSCRAAHAVAVLRESWWSGSRTTMARCKHALDSGWLRSSAKDALHFLKVPRWNSGSIRLQRDRSPLTGFLPLKLSSAMDSDAVGWCRGCNFLMLVWWGDAEPHSH